MREPSSAGCGRNRPCSASIRRASLRTAGSRARISPLPQQSSTTGRPMHTVRAPRPMFWSSCHRPWPLSPTPGQGGSWGSKTNIRDVSPDAHVRRGLPPTIILQGSTDSVTPLAGVKRFCDRMIAAGNMCELHVYEGFGHLFTPAGIPDDGQPRPDPATRADALAKAEQFLKSRGFIR